MFNANGTTVTEKLGLDSSVRELKFGSSFQSGGSGSKNQQGGFHTIRYDFKPASVDPSKMASLEVGQSGQVTISMPHYDNNGSTVFKGSTRPVTKECVLIIDNVTGEVTLEKLSHNVQVKKTRQEGASKSSKSGGGQSSQTVIPERSSLAQSAPIRNDMTKHVKEESFTKIKEESKRNPTLSSHPQHLSASSSSGHNRKGNSPMVSSRHSPVQYQNSPSNNFENKSSAFDHRDNHVSKQSNAMPSLTSIEDLLITPPQPPPQPQHPPTNVKSSSSHHNADSKSGIKHASKVAAGAGDLSADSSSGDDSSSSSSSDDDSSSVSDMEEVAIPDVVVPPSSSVVMKSSRDSRDVIPSTRPPPHMGNMSMPNFSLEGLSTKSSTNTTSMPSHLLSEDLQLSESGSDSD